jgi:hypothetical protein
MSRVTVTKKLVVLLHNFYIGKNVKAVYCNVTNCNSSQFNRINGKDNVSSFLKLNFIQCKNLLLQNVSKTLANNQSEVSSQCLFS